MNKVAKGILCLALGVAAIAVSAGENSYVGANNGDWDADSNWSLGVKPTADDDVVVDRAVVASGMNPLVAKSIIIANGGALTVGAAGMTDIHPSVAVIGDFTLNGNATFSIFAGPTNDTHDFRTGGATVSVGGAFDWQFDDIFDLIHSKKTLVANNNHQPIRKGRQRFVVNGCPGCLHG